MHAPRKLTEAEFCGIEWHTTELLAACTREIDKIQEIPRINRPEFLRNQLLYWKHAKAALEWSLEIAKQRKRKPKNG